MKKILFTDKAPAPIGPYNQAVLSGNTLYTSADTLFVPMNIYINNQQTTTFTNSTMQLWDVGGNSPILNNQGIQMGKSALGAYASMNMSELIAYTDNQEFTNRQPISYGINSYYNIYPQTSSFTTSSFISINFGLTNPINGI